MHNTSSRSPSFPASLLLGLALLFLSAPSNGALINSAQTGPWSDPATWVGVSTPTASDEATILSGHTVTVAITSAAVSTTTISGTLSFSRVENSSLTVVGGSVTVTAGGWLDMGTYGDEIVNVTARLILAYGSTPGQFALTVQNGGNFTVKGATKTVSSFATANISGPRTGAQVAGDSIGGWLVGDVITIGPTSGSGTGSTEKRIIGGITGTDPKTISWSPGLSADRSLSGFTPIRLGNLTHNVGVRSSSTYAEAGTAYIRNLVENTTSFSLVFGQFVYLGANVPGKYGIVFEGSGVKGDISSSTIHDGYDGLYIQDASSNSFLQNLFYGHADDGIQMTNSSTNTFRWNLSHGNTGRGLNISGDSPGCFDNEFSSNSIYSNGSKGIEFYDGSRNAFEWGAVFSNGEHGVYAVGTSTNTFRGNDIYRNVNTGIELRTGSNNNIVESNRAYYNESNYGLLLEASEYNLVRNNTISFNFNSGIVLNAANHNVLLKNNSFSHSAGYGFYLLNSDNNLLTRNAAYNNTNGFSLNGTIDNMMIANRAYSNSAYGLYVQDASSITFANGSLGYDSANAPNPNTTAEIGFNSDANKESLILKSARVNPTGGVEVLGLNETGNHIISYNQDFDTGTVRVWGDYVVYGGTLTLEYGGQVYASSTTMPVTIRGTGHSAAVAQTYDADAISQIISIEYRSGEWHVAGSSSGADLVTPFTGNQPALDIPTASPQVRINFTEGASPQEDDWVGFGLLAASGDANMQKRLLIGPPESSFNKGRGRIRVVPDGGVELKGTPGYPTILDRLDGSSTYYTFIGSGAFTAEYSSMTNMDPDGLQLSGTAGVSLASSTLDFMGVADATNAYITARDLTSDATFYGLTFGTSRSTAGSQYTYNVLVEGSDAGLRWMMRRWNGPIGGWTMDYDPNGKVIWTPFKPLPGSPAISAVYPSSVAAQWTDAGNDDGTIYHLEASTAADFSGSSDLSSATVNITDLVTGLSPNTTYYLQVSAVSGSTSPYSDLGSTITLASPPLVTAPTFHQVTATSLSAIWDRNGNPVDITTYTVALTTGSSYPNTFSGNDSFSTSPAGGSPAATFSGLVPNTTYYLFVEAVNHGGAGSGYVPLGSTATLVNIPTTAASTFPEVAPTSMTVAWNANSNPVDVTTYTVVLTTGSSYPNTFSGNESFSTAPAGGSPAATFTGLVPNTTYYLSVEAVNHGGTGSGYAALGSSVTWAMPPASTVSTFTAVNRSSMTVAWDVNGNPEDITRYTVVLTSGSSYPNAFTGNISST
ncbi:right-handed parallel beta-helix repeat-containing protein, partial [Elusimicrobiota bacterium]